jgi:hypothetical protein
MKALSQREKLDLNSGDANNAHAGADGKGGDTSGGAGAGEGESDRSRHKLPDTIDSNVCFDFSNGSCSIRIPLATVCAASRDVWVHYVATATERVC